MPPCFAVAAQRQAKQHYNNYTVKSERVKSIVQLYQPGLDKYFFLSKM